MEDLYSAGKPIFHGLDEKQLSDCSKQPFRFRNIPAMKCINMMFAMTCSLVKGSVG
jgi:hypothetical protein